MSTRKTNKIIKTKLTNKYGEIPGPGVRKSMKLGDCIFPFTYNNKEHYDCYKGKMGKICVTQLEPWKFAFCDNPELPKRKSSNKKVNKSRKKKIKIKQSKNTSQLRLPPAGWHPSDPERIVFRAGCTAAPDLQESRGPSPTRCEDTSNPGARRSHPEASTR